VDDCAVGTESDAIEEVVIELGLAFLSDDLGMGDGLDGAPSLGAPPPDPQSAIGATDATFGPHPQEVKR
jgi:hypothetical protein